MNMEEENMSNLDSIGVSTDNTDISKQDELPGDGEVCCGVLPPVGVVVFPSGV